MKRAIVYILFLVFIISCTEEEKNLTQIFNKKVTSYTQIKLPHNFDPNKEPDFSEEVFMTDSLFIINFIDKHQFDEDAGDRTYGYYEGSTIFENENIIGILYLFGFSVGHEYRLYTYSKEEPQIIDSLKISEFASDYSRTYGEISDSLTIWRKTDFLDWDETTEKNFVKKSIEETFRVNEQGMIQRTSQNTIKKNLNSNTKLNFTTPFDTIIIEPNSIVFFKPTEFEFKDLLSFLGKGSGIYEVDSDFGYYINQVADSLKGSEIEIIYPKERIIKIKAFDGSESYMDRLENGTNQYGIIFNYKKSEPVISFGVHSAVDIYSMLKE